MSKEVLLMADVDGLGTVGAVVRVADGYARNFLFPRKLAAPVTDATRRRMEKVKREREAARKVQAEAASKEADRLKGVSVTVKAKVKEGEQLYGSVGVADIIDALNRQDIKLERQAIQLDTPLRQTGEFEVKVRLGPDVETTIKVCVVKE